MKLAWDDFFLKKKFVSDRAQWKRNMMKQENLEKVHHKMIKTTKPVTNNKFEIEVKKASTPPSKYHPFRANPSLTTENGRKKAVYLQKNLYMFPESQNLFS